MTSHKNEVNVVSSNNDVEVEPLQVVYYCNVQEKKKLDVVVELERRKTTVDIKVPQRFTLVIDVSGSMSQPVNEYDHRTLMERVKNFANFFIDNTNSSNWVAIVTFSDQAWINMPMTRMTQNGKAEAMALVSRLIPLHTTNLEAGLMVGLEASCQFLSENDPTHDCLILFTDGEATEGELNPENLINKYKNKMQYLKQTRRKNNVQLAAVTFDYYTPILINEIRKNLSGDAFYVLNCQQDFELDMLIPLFLRQEPCISDLNLNFSCLKGAEFHLDSVTKSGLINQFENIKLQYFFYTLPGSSKKHIRLSMDITKFNGNFVLEVNKSYLDENLVERNGKDFLQLNFKTMNETRLEESNIEIPKDRMALQEKYSSYSISHNVMNCTWEDAQLSFVTNVKVQARESAIDLLNISSSYKSKDEILSAKHNLNQGVEIMNELKDFSKSVLGEDNMYCKKLDQNLTMVASNLKYGAENMENIPWARLQGMVSSFETEMPTASGVFEPETAQPFMSPEIEEKIAETSVAVLGDDGDRVNEYQKRVLERESAERKLQQAMKERNAEKIESRMTLCLEKGVDENKIKDAEKLLRIVEKEDVLINKIGLLLQEPDEENLTKLVEEFRNSPLKFVDKTGIVKEAETYLRKESLKKLMNSIRVARENENPNKMEKLIKSLKDYENEGLVDPNIVSQHQADLAVLRIEINLKSRCESLKNSINAMIRFENLPNLEKNLLEMKDLMAEKHFKVNDSHKSFYTKALESLATLKEKQKLVGEISDVFEKSEIPFVPENLEVVKNILRDIEELKMRANQYTNAFTDIDEKNLTRLDLKIKNLESSILLRDAMEETLKEALQNRDYEELCFVVSQAEETDFVNENLINQCKKLAKFLNPKTRVKALERSFKKRNVEDLEKSILEFESAGVSTHTELYTKAVKRLKKLKRIDELNELLRQAIDSKDLQTLQSALDSCESSKMKTSDLSFFEEAQKLFFVLSVENLRNILKNAINERSTPSLIESMRLVDESGYKEFLMDEYEAAEECLKHLENLRRLRETIAKMSERQISEIKRYLNPPHLIKLAMEAFFLMLGEPLKVVQDWPNLQKMITNTGSNNLGRRIKHCNPQEIDPKQRKTIKSYVDNIDVEDVKQCSNEAATFYAWVKCMLLESEHFDQ